MAAPAASKPATPHVERRLAAILAADVVGYSRLVGEDEAGTVARLKALRLTLIEPLIAAHHGRIVKLMGDGALCEFASVVDAVTCAVAVQQAMAQAEPDEPADRRIRFRIGINLGDIIIEDGDIFGDGVNIAARLEQLAEPGGICVSRTVKEHVQGRLDVALSPMGARRLKNIAEPVEAWRVVLDGGKPVRRPILAARPKLRPAPAGALALLLAGVAGVGGWWWHERQVAAALASAKPGIAVLPFDNFSGDPAQARLADGITEDIITNLARFRDLDVIARNTTMTYKGKAVDVKQVGKDLGVRYVLEGSLQRAGERVRVTAQLIDATTGAHVWSERWDRPAGDVFAVQSEVAEKVGSTLAGYTGLIGEADRMRAKRERPENLAAYDLYLLGVEAKHRLTKESVAEAIRLHRRATELDPGFACAWMGLAWALQVSRRWADDAERPELARQALAAAERAVQLDPMDAEAHAALGSTFGINGDLIQCAAELGKALDLNPSSADILTFYADWASSFGEPEGVPPRPTGRSGSTRTCRSGRRAPTATPISWSAATRTRCATSVRSPRSRVAGTTWSASPRAWPRSGGKRKRRRRWASSLLGRPTSRPRPT